MSTVERIAVIGGGECAARFVTSLRERGYEGAITVVGDELHAPYERPPLSKAAIVDEVEPSPVTIATAERLADLDVEFVPGTRATAIDRDGREVQLADGRRVGYDRLLLATGARPRSLPVEGGELAMSLRTFDDAVALRARFRPGTSVAIIGAGFIGLELAAAAIERGCRVTVLEVAPRVMGRAVPADLADVVAKRHLAAGVDLRCGAVVRGVTRHGDGFRVELDELASPVGADVVVAGVGAVPNTELAEEVGLEIANGIAVDEFLRTSDPNVYAAGDCCSAPHPVFGGARIRLESWRNAHDQALVAAANVLGGCEPHTAVPWFWSDQYELGLQIAGLPHLAEREVVRERDDGGQLRFGLDGAGRLVAASGLAEGTKIAKDIRVAEMLIAGRRCPDPGSLADPSTSLKSVLKS